MSNKNFKVKNNLEIEGGELLLGSTNVTVDVDGDLNIGGAKITAGAGGGVNITSGLVVPDTPSVGDQWFIGASEIGGFLFFLGLFIFVVFKELTKAPLLAKGDPYMGESERFHY